MSLTPQQLAALKAAIDADPTMAAFPMNSDGHFALADYLNAADPGGFIVWRGPMQVSEIEQNGFAWNQLDNVPAAKFRIWELLRSTGTINPSKANVRQGINDFCKDQSGVVITALRDSILPHLKKTASRAEKILATGTGTDAVPATLGYFGSLAWGDVQAARES